MAWWETILIMMGFMMMSSPIGYEYLDNETLHVWNNGTVEPHYFYSGNCLNDLSNDPFEKWEDVKKYFGTEIQGEWRMVDWSEQQDCIRTDITDNLTFVNNTANTIIEQQSFHINMTMNSHLNLNDDLLSQIYTFYSHQGTEDKTWFLLSSQNITVGGDSENDYLKIHLINGSVEEYSLNSISENGTTLYFNSSEYYPYYFLSDVVKSKNIQHEWWNQSYNWVLKVNDSVNLFIELGEFEQRETKQFTRKWVDAVCSCSGFGLSANSFIQIIDNETDVGQDPQIECRSAISGIGSCSGCALYYRDQLYGTPRNIPINANTTDILDCDPPVATPTCSRLITVYQVNTWYPINTTFVNPRIRIGLGVNCMHQGHRALGSNNPSATLLVKGYGYCNRTSNNVPTNYSSIAYNPKFNSNWSINESIYCNDEVLNISGSIKLQDKLLLYNTQIDNMTHITGNSIGAVIGDYLSKIGGLL